MNWWAIWATARTLVKKISCCDDVIYTDYRVPRTATIVATRPVFPFPDPTPPLGAYGASIVSPLLALSLGFMRPIFSVPIVATLNVTNVVQGKRSQR